MYSGAMLKSLKNSFLAGLIILLPISITIVVVNFMLDYIGEPASRILFYWLDISVRNTAITGVVINILSTLFVFILITVIGWLSRYFLGKFLFNLTESLINRVPLIRTIYNSLKQIVKTFGENKMSAFNKTVLVKYPNRDTYAVGFLTGDTAGEVQHKTDQHVVNVFVPTTPNPTSGFLLMVPQEDVIELDMSVGDGIKMIISGGIVVPPYNTKKGD
ncbi:MAG: DUF502 domain-containing protein [Puniceicoccales bacterium]|jgi:uncharacterized membrane protein|nr:DUF502 domain-containing protein [Puniceicoccales bacterium]